MSEATYYHRVKTAGQLLAAWPVHAHAGSYQASAPATTHRAVIFGVLTYNEKTVELKQSLVAVLSQKHDHWAIECSELGINAVAMDEASARNEFAAEFIATWDGIRDEPKSRLTADAVRLQARFLEYVS